MLHQGSSSYSDLVITPDRTICCLYERADFPKCLYEKITFAKFNIEWLTDSDDQLSYRRRCSEGGTALKRHLRPHNPTSYASQKEVIRSRQYPAGRAGILVYSVLWLFRLACLKGDVVILIGCLWLRQLRQD